MVYFILQLIKVEDGLCEGEVLYHKLIEKTPEEKLLIRKQRNIKKYDQQKLIPITRLVFLLIFVFVLIIIIRRQKNVRKREQEMNIEKKLKDKEAHKRRCLEGAGVVQDHKENENMQDETDADWYRKEVGEDPEEGMFSETQQQQSQGDRRPGKRRSEGHRGDGLGNLEMRPRINKFTKVKEKAKQMKLDRQRNALRGRSRDGMGRSSRGGGRGRGKGDGTYSKPGRGKGMGSKPNMRVSGKRGGSSRGGSGMGGGRGGSRGGSSGGRGGSRGGRDAGGFRGGRGGSRGGRGMGRGGGSRGRS